jgi:hypothetical protein
MAREDESPLVKRNSAIAGESGAEVDITYGGGNSQRGSDRDAGQTIADASSPPEDVGKKGGLGAGLLKVVLFSVTVLVYTLQPILNEQGMATKSVVMDDVTERKAPMYMVEPK